MIVIKSLYDHKKQPKLVPRQHSNLQAYPNAIELRKFIPFFPEYLKWGASGIELDLNLVPHQYLIFGWIPLLTSTFE